MRTNAPAVISRYACSLLFLACAVTVRAQPVRAEVPIRAVQLSDGTIRFAVPILVGGQPVLAGLDTGSSGLQLLPAAQHNLGPAGAELRASYGSGVLLSGHAASATVQIGEVKGEVVANQVQEVGCVPKKPDCGGSKVPIQQFGILGDGLPNEGFAALLGTRTQREARPGHPSNPLRQLGVERWIVELPQPNNGEAGRLILNPTEAELAGFVTVPNGAATGEVQACLDRPAPAETHVCGSTSLDSGAPGITILGGDAPREARQGSPARIAFGSDRSPLIAIGIRLDERVQMSRYRVADANEQQNTELHLGPLPYLALSVLYDAKAGTMALRPRRSYPGGPVLLPQR